MTRNGPRARPMIGCWSAAFAGDSPRKAGNLDGAAPPASDGHLPDWHALPFVTMDSSAARDHDDAVQVEGHAGGERCASPLPM